MFETSLMLLLVLTPIRKLDILELDVRELIVRDFVDVVSGVEAQRNMLNTMCIFRIKDLGIIIV